MSRILNPLSLACLLALSSSALASTYPLTLTDTDGRQITLDKEPERVVVQDGRDILALALLDREDPFRRVVAWNNILKKSDSSTWKLMAGKWPEAEKIFDMGFSDKGEVNPESVIAEHPNLVIAQLRLKAALTQIGVVDKLKQLGIPLLFIDTFQNPVEDTPKSITLLGQALNREKEAQEYTTFFQQHYQAILDKVRDIQPKPRVFFEAKAGLGGVESCCFTHGNVGWGAMVSAVGATNLGSTLLPGATGTSHWKK
ncbi:MAG: Vitamin B12-binding protein [Candidatus Erwinia impunctatus]